MTKQKDLKRRIRERMRRTGESYTTARLHVLVQRPEQPEGGPASRPGKPPRLRLGRRRRTRRMPHLRYVAPLFTVVLCLVVGMTGLILIPPGEGLVPAPEAASTPSPGGP